MKKIICLAIIASLVSMGSAFAAPNYEYKQNTVQPSYERAYYPVQQTNVSPNQTLRGSVISVPAGALIPTIVTNPLSSEFLTLGQMVTISLGSDFYYNNNLIAPAGSSVTGTVIEVSRAKRGSINGKLCIRFTQITTPYGLQIPISGVIKTDDGTGTLVGGTKFDVIKDYGKDMAVGTAAGALSGVIFGALSGGSVGKGAALGTAVGAGGGLVKSVIDKGDDVSIPAGASIEIQLTQPITVNPSVYSYD